MRLRFSFATILVAGAVVALAQPGGPPPGGGPGPGPRMGGGMGMMGGAFLLMRADVQKELGLSTDQIAKLKKLAPQGGMMGGPGGPGGRPPAGGGPGAQSGQRGGPPMGGGPGGPGNGGPMAAFQEYQKKIDAILTKPQSTRLQELGLQLAGPMSVMRPDIAEKLGVTEAQRKKIFESMGSMRPAPPKEGEPPKMPSREEMRAMMKKAGDTVLAVLTADQKKRWQAMLGKPFKFQEPD